MIDRELHRARALLVEGNPMLRTVAAGQLRDLGVGHVASTSKVRDARLMLERERFDIVVCCREFEGHDDSGQDLLDELRRERLLPHSTVFLMINSRASYHQVVEAGEAALDGFLLRPYTTAALSQRLLDARQRKRELNDVLHALDAGETELALVRAVKRFSERAGYWVYCGRLAAELLLTLERPDDARKVFERLAEAKPLAWARIGAARCHFAQGNVSAARHILDSVLASEPGCADAHDLLGRLLVEQCDFEAALECYRNATRLTPGCLLRQQHTGALAFYQGQPAEAEKHLQLALSMGLRSKLFDALTLLLLALLRFDANDREGVATMRQQLGRYRERYPTSARLDRLADFVDTLHMAITQGASAVRGTMARLGQQVDEDGFDLESAAMLLALARRLPDGFETPLDYEHLVQRIGKRFASSKAITEVLVGVAGHSHPATGLLRACYTDTTKVAEDAMGKALKGDPGSAVRMLLTQTRSVRNARLLEIARSLIKRYRAQMADADAQEDEAQALVNRLGHAGNHIAGIQRSGRGPGAMHLRGAEPKPALPAPAASLAASAAPPA